MARQLVTEFKKIATAGKTVDGREISAQDLLDIAETYDPSEYTANIWYEHIRVFGNLGKVVEVKTELDDKSRVCLFGRLSPTAELMNLNQNGQKVFTSVEIQPNFSGSGKAYLVGLAVTDSPASVGTSELHFSSRALNPGNVFSNPIEVDFFVRENDVSHSTLQRLFNLFSHEPNKSQDEDAMNEQQFSQLHTAIETQNETGKNLLEAFNALADSLKPAGQTPEAPTPEAPVENPPAQQGITAEEFNALKTQLDGLTEKYNALMEETEGTLVDETTGDAGAVEVI